MATGNLYQSKITKRQFFSDLEMGKRVVDAGFKNYFILLDSTSFKGTRTIGGTTLADIKDIYDGFPIYKCFRFAIPHYEVNGGDVVHASSIVIRDITKKDKNHLRKHFKFFPVSTYVAELTDQDGFEVLYPFKQNTDGTIVPLYENNIYRKEKASWEQLQSCSKAFGGSVFQYVVRIIELLPDIIDSLLAVVNYKGVDICIPVEKTTAKQTFRTREKDGDRRKHLIHNVNQFDRKNLKKVDKVKSHLRGTSELVIDGQEVCLMGTSEWGIRQTRRNHSDYKGGIIS